MYTVLMFESQNHFLVKRVHSFSTLRMLQTLAIGNSFLLAKYCMGSIGGSQIRT